MPPRGMAGRSGCHHDVWRGRDATATAEGRGRWCHHDGWRGRGPSAMAMDGGGAVGAAMTSSGFAGGYMAMAALDNTGYGIDNSAWRNLEPTHCRYTATS